MTDRRYDYPDDEPDDACDHVPDKDLEDRLTCPLHRVSMCHLKEKLPWHVRAVINTAPIWLTAILGWASFITIRSIRDEERWSSIMEWRERVKELETCQRTMIENQGRILTLTEEIRRRLDSIHPKGTN